ncbi:toxin-antitoxin system YwqK family antitoxin [Pontibacter sp. 13R65]|uniref:toxin-antitoxin system YwqK family antitoxin n=1 Tax=Pontibacter sp. 13R65 TaxID=3127458 RepID=UPI00301DC027
MKRYILLLFMLYPLFVAAEAPEKADQDKGFLFFKINRFDKEGQFHGRWKVYHEEDGYLIRKGRFRHGREVGKWKYYYPDGTTYMVERWKPRKGEILVKRYNENGTLNREGKARLDTTGERLRFYWFGDWKVYNENGQYSHTEKF